MTDSTASHTEILTLPFVTQYGLRLLPDLYEGFNPMGYEEAVDREIEIGIDLRSAGFGVWQA